MEKSFNPTKLIFYFLSFLIPFTLYVITLAPTVSFIDSGELAAVCIKLGIAHPTGYPLFTIIGNIFSKFPLGEPIFRLNLLCAVISSAASLMFFKLILLLFKTLAVDIKSVLNKYIIALTSSLTLAFSLTYWNSSNAIEVYALHIFFLITIIYLFIKANFEKSNLNYWIIFGFVLGLSFTNHLTTVFLSVGTLYLFFANNGFNELTFKKVIAIAIAFILALTVYIYFPVRADNNVLSWGYPSNWESLYRHVSGKQFSVWMFSSSENASKQFSYFMSSFPKEFFFFPLIIAIFGLIKLYSLNKKIFFYFALLFVFTVLYAINYDIYDIDSYFLLAYIVAAVWIAFGILFLYEKIDLLKQYAFLFLIIPLIICYQNYSNANENDNFYVQDMTMNVFASAEQNAIIMSTQWDFWVSASFYYQYIKNIRPDIIVIDKELLRRSWYLIHIKKHFPDVYNNCKFEFDTYAYELDKFEKFTNRYTNPSTEADRQDLMKIQKAFSDLLNAIPEKNQDRPFYTTYEIEQGAPQEKFGENFNRIPQGMLFRYSKNSAFDNYTEPNFTFQITNKTGYHYNFIMNSYISAYLSRANYLINFSKFQQAENLINKALEINPNLPDAVKLLKKSKELQLPK
ncbi:MAG TPA: DUF2723 domain-containing protein [Ignavibacteria bacterium]|nr:DUF2723 domain-containing protein [Ignavibacteria bacterium]